MTDQELKDGIKGILSKEIGYTKERAEYYYKLAIDNPNLSLATILVCNRKQIESIMPIMEQEPAYVCDHCKMQARQQALETAMEMSEGLRNMGMYGKPELLKDAEEIAEWILTGGRV